MSGRIVPTILWAMLVMLSAAPAGIGISPDFAMGRGSPGQVGAVGMRLAHKPCTAPNCAYKSNFAANTSMSDCGMGGMSCSLCATTLLPHHSGELCFRHGVAVAMQDPPNPILTNRSISIFHPPRLYS